MTDIEIRELIEKELFEKSFGTIEQYLEIHSPVYEEGKLEIACIDRSLEGEIIVYLSVKEEEFYFIVYINIVERKIVAFDTEAHYRVFLIAFMLDQFIDISNLDSYNRLEIDLIKHLNLEYAWKKGEKMRGRSRLHEDNGLKFEPTPEPDTLENKLNRLLDILEENKEGMSAFSQKVDFIKIQTFISYHRGNQLLGSFVLDKALLNRISQFNIALEFDISAWGKPFNESNMQE